MGASGSSPISSRKRLKYGEALQRGKYTIAVLGDLLNLIWTTIEMDNSTLTKFTQYEIEKTCDDILLACKRCEYQELRQILIGSLVKEVIRFKTEFNKNPSKNIRIITLYHEVTDVYRQNCMAMRKLSHQVRYTQFKQRGQKRWGDSCDGIEVGIKEQSQEQKPPSVSLSPQQFEIHFAELKPMQITKDNLIKAFSTQYIWGSGLTPDCIFTPLQIKDKICLDVGCGGTALTCFYWHKLGAKLSLGIDINPVAVECCNDQLLRWKFLKDKLIDLDYLLQWMEAHDKNIIDNEFPMMVRFSSIKIEKLPSDYFDFVNCAHLGNQSKEFYQEVSRIAKPKGIIRVYPRQSNEWMTKKEVLGIKDKEN